MINSASARRSALHLNGGVAPDVQGQLSAPRLSAPRLSAPQLSAPRLSAPRNARKMLVGVRVTALVTSWGAASLLGIGCGDVDYSPEPEPNRFEFEVARTGNCNVPGEMKCVGPMVQICTLDDLDLSWAPPVECPINQSCRGGQCKYPSPEQYAQAEAAAAYVEQMAQQSAGEMTIAPDVLAEGTQDAILSGNGSNLTYFTAMRAIQLSVAQGHQTLHNAVCDSPAMFAQHSSRFGVCARPLGDEMVVTHAAAGNRLGLLAGDRIVQVDNDKGLAMLEAAAHRPVCGMSSPSTWHRRASAAASFFGTVPEGANLLVESVDGTARSVVVPDTHDAVSTSCQDPLGRKIDFDIQAHIRADGIGVVRVPRFFPIGKSLPPNPTDEDIAIFTAAYIEDLAEGFALVQAAPMVIWDVRSNSGGFSQAGLSIAGGMSSAVATPLSGCQTRMPGTQPPIYSETDSAEFAVAPGGPFGYTGKVAVLVDELNYSAADYFPLAVARATNGIIVGTPTAGAYGSIGESLKFEGPPFLGVSFDPSYCFDADGVPLEGKGVEPDIFVQYDPADLAKGVDTVMEAAASELLKKAEPQGG